MPARESPCELSFEDADVNEGDVIDIFQEVGPVKSAVVHYSRDGNSLGTAEITFVHKEHAMKAVNEYDGVRVFLLNLA